MNNPIPLLNVFKWYVLLKLLVICVNCLLKGFESVLTHAKCPSAGSQKEKGKLVLASVPLHILINVATHF